MKVILRHPTRELEVSGAKSVADLLRRLDIVAESVLVIRDGDLLTSRDSVGDDDTVELRPVISGG